MVDHAVVLQYIQTLGFPVCMAVALFWVLWKIGSRIVESFFEHVNTVHPKVDRIANAMEKIATKFDDWPSDPGELCQAREAMRAAGMDDKTIDRVLTTRRQRRAEKGRETQ